MNKESDIVNIIGREKTLLLEQAFGATRKYIPQTIAEDSDIAQCIGWESANRLSDYFGGMALYIPTTLAMIARNQTIIAAYCSGTPTQDIACHYGLVARTVRKICQGKHPSPCPQGHAYGKANSGCRTNRCRDAAPHPPAGRHTSTGEHAGEQCH